MNILIAGLGLIGGSLAKALKNNNFIAGYDRENVLEFALNNGIIDEKAKSYDSYDFVIVALPPLAVIDFINNNNFKDNAIVTDICGVKEAIEKALNKNRNFNYVGCHPMAGKEVGGIENSAENLFQGASLIITVNENTCPESVQTVETIYNQAGFSKIVKCSAEHHDKVIAYTSQLAHIVSNAYVKSPTISLFEGFTGGSFQDMTRIAGLNEDIWTDLFFLNRVNILNELNTLINSLKVQEHALLQNNKEKMKEALRKGKSIKQKLKK